MMASSGPSGSRPDRPHRRRTTVVSACRRAVALPWRRLAPAAAAGAVSCACGVGLLATSGWLITRASTRPPVFVISVAVGAVQAFALGRGLLRYVQRVLVHGVALDVLGGLRLRLFDDAEPLAPGGLPGGTGAVLSAAVADTELVTHGLVQGVTAAVDVTASVVLGVLVAALVAPGPAAVLAVGALVAVGTALLAGRLGRAQVTAAAERRAELADEVVGALRAAPELVAYGRSDLVASRLDDVAERAMAGACRLGVGVGLGRAFTTWVSGAAVMAVVVTGLAATSSGHLSGVLLAVVVFAALAVVDQVVALPAVLADTAAARAAAGRLVGLADGVTPVAEPAAAGPEGAGDGSAALERVTVAAGGGRRLLDDVSMAVAPGRRLVVAGPSGAGKTTAINALLRFVAPTAGRATVGGDDVARLSRATLARRAGWVAADTHLFAASVADNLRVARPGASDEELRGGLARVGLGPWLASLPEGLDTALGAGGRPVSAGERQRLAMARALLADGPLLLLDEPTAHVDPATRPALLAELVGAAGERTVVLVSHDAEALACADAVVTLDAGRVTVDGCTPAPA